MCGIAGILHPNGLPRAELRGKLAQLQRALRRRGPDGSGLWQNDSGTAGFAHTRLAVIDPGPAAAQPMTSCDGRYHITFNGEIYNHNELRRELEENGATFRTRSDTEVLLALYARDGADMLAKLRGMFAFAIWDELEPACFLARDPLGIKPLYYARQEGVLAFASEIRALQSAGLAGNEINRAALLGYLLRGSVREPDTLLASVRCLEAGHCLTWKEGRIEDRAYWRLDFAPQDMDEKEAVAEARAALLDSAQAHFVSDVPVGLFLSSGMDSSALLALAGVLGKSGPGTFTLGVDQESLDETAVAARTAAHFGAAHHEWRVTRERAEGAFQEYLKAMDQPTFDGFNTFLVAGFARGHGLKAALSGVGGDELFGGYPSFSGVPKMLAAARALRRLPGLAALAGGALERWGASPKWRRTGSFFKAEPTLQQAFQSFRGLFSMREARQIASAYLLLAPEDVPAREHPPPMAKEIPDAISECELTVYMRNQLLRDSDVMSMTHGLELRTPFADATLTRRLARIPSKWRLQPGKRLLQQAVPEIPAWVTDHAKRIFVFPFESWLKSAWGAEFDGAASKLPGLNHTWFQRWTVFVLDHWLARHSLRF